MATRRRKDEPQTVKEQAEESVPRGIGVDPEDYDQNEVAPYRVEDQDVSGFLSVSQEYKTYSTHVHAPATNLDSAAADARAERARGDFDEPPQMRTPVTTAGGQASAGTPGKSDDNDE